MSKIIQAFPKGMIVHNEFTTAFKNAKHYHDALLRCSERISVREYIDIDDKLSKTNKCIFDDWIVDTAGHEVDGQSHEGDQRHQGQGRVEPRQRMGSSATKRRPGNGHGH